MSLRMAFVVRLASLLRTCVVLIAASLDVV
jgi:hypothetical protein